MALKNTILQSKEINSEFSNYIRSTFEIRDPIYNALFNDELANMKDSLYKGPYLHAVLPFKTAQTINQLINEGILERDFTKFGEDGDRPLYVHQCEAIKKIQNKRNVAITTGTGSGKTECFLYPILNELIKELKSGAKDSEKAGIRAILMFPMNALINDQIDRLRGFLKGYPAITFGFFTGETPRDEKDERYEKYVSSNGIDVISNEILTRREMREKPPHILFTNFSMLEYMLIRPEDSAIISPETLKHWRFLVLDEAHTYSGSHGIEITLLLRRLVGFARHKPQYILTSATLGKGIEDREDIKRFVSTLTSSYFDDDDIIFSERIPLKREGTYAIDENDYKSLYDSLEDSDSCIKIFKKYNVFYDRLLPIENNLFNLLSADRNVLRLYDGAKDGVVFYKMKDEILGFKDELNLVALIELIMKAKSIDNKKLFDIKYHMFIKALDGAFITLGKNKKIKLINTNYIDGYKAFKIGICQNCKTPYVMGKEEGGFLYIDDEVDIDEEYMYRVKDHIDYYLIGDTLADSEIEDIETNQKDKFKKYKVCPKCGRIRAFDDPRANKCDCNEEEVILYKYKEDTKNDDYYSNNLRKCPICTFRSKNSGVVLGFHIGNDRATALIAQILYRSMEYPQILNKTSDSVFDDGVKYRKGIKQFLTFSDSRQQAAFFSKFLSNADDRFLKKRMIWELLCENNHNPIGFKKLVEDLEMKFKKPPLLYNSEEAHKQAYGGALYELLDVDGRNGAEGLGLFAFVLQLPQEYQRDISASLRAKGFLNITSEEFRTLTKFCLSMFRTVPAINYPIISNDINEMDDLLGYRKFDNYVVKKDDSKIKRRRNNIQSFLPKSNRNTKLVKYIMKILDCDRDKAIRFLDLIYNTAKETKVIEQERDGDKISDSNYSVYSYLDPNIRFYYCSKCKKITIYNVKDKCSDGDCNGRLIEIKDLDEYFKTNYYRKEYKTRPLERVVIKEHTAQITSRDARKIQDDFKDKKINIISCSTTFEMGIDLGGLSTIFMKNIPPTPANYVQRAGRAGRRSDIPAFILTFCSNTSHDYTFFSDPTPMIRGMVKPPFFVIENEKIITRHIADAALSFYFRNNSDAYLPIKDFIEKGKIDEFIQYIYAKPKDLGEYIDTYVLDNNCDLINVYGDFRWISYVGDISRSNLRNMGKRIEELIADYDSAIKKLSNERPKNYVESIKNCSAALKKFSEPHSLINYLSTYGVIPRYGFPVDNVNLFIYDTKMRAFNDKYNLTRDLTLAISEYAPESEIIVDKKKFTSRYIYTPYSDDSQIKNYYVKCDNCKQYNVFPTKEEIQMNQLCKYCHESLKISQNKSNVEEFIRPIRGFVTGANKNTGRDKPARTYSSDIQYIGDGKNVSSESLRIGEVIEIIEYKNEELLVLNENNFYYCPDCGYTEIIKDIYSQETKKEHKTHRGDLCRNNILYRTHLGHTFKTDVVRIKFKLIDSLRDKDTALSTLYALLEGISGANHIDRRDIGGMIYRPNPRESSYYEMLIFDTAAGGAGNVKVLRDKRSVMEILHCALAKVSQDCCDENTSCYNCLRNYANQRVHKHLKRKLAKEAIVEILTKVKQTQDELAN